MNANVLDSFYPHCHNCHQGHNHDYLNQKEGNKESSVDADVLDAKSSGSKNAREAGVTLMMMMIIVTMVGLTSVLKRGNLLMKSFHTKL